MFNGSSGFYCTCHLRPNDFSVQLGTLQVAKRRDLPGEASHPCQLANSSNSWCLSLPFVPFSAPSGRCQPIFQVFHAPRMQLGHMLERSGRFVLLWLLAGPGLRCWKWLHGRS